MFTGRSRQWTRRRVLVGGAALVAGAAAVDAFGVEPRWLEVELISHAVEGLPASLQGLRIAQITDAHLTSLGRVEDRILESIVAAAPQVVALTGDMIDDEADTSVLAELCAALAGTGAKVVSTLGNWEHWGALDLAALREVYAKTHTTLLVDDWLEVEGVSLYASDDSTAGSPAAIAAPGREGPRVLLTHSPAFVDRDHGEAAFDLCLSGHTHGGQITAAGLAPFTPPGSGDYVAGWYDTTIGPMYVSRGTGTSIVPARFTCRPELPIIELVRA
ncbi:MAG: metallophosphoesterase [Nannocystaceae bacterium]|nr:metallophosphoesterase [bacterium]